ncbi:hypothetical protein O3P69_005776 [Scylla paramamosain]|uniref:Uncharacterized protein n=1 Tax=Scylla paramamosain TaxID=85552 RepID=A0AAW0U9F1_SCYPA
MDESHESSGTLKSPENSTCEAIIYNEIELTKCSIFKPFSLSYCRGSPANYTGIGGKVKSPPGKAAKKTVPAAHSSKRSARKTEVSTAHNGETVTPNKLTDNSAHSSKNSACSPKPRGQKRKLEYSEKAEACPVVNGEDQSLSPKFRRRKGSISGQKSPRKARNQSLPDERDSLHSPRMSRKKQKLEAREQSGDETRSPRKAAGFSPRITRRRSGSGGLNKQKAESGKAGVKTYESNTNNNNNNINNRLADVSATPLKNQSNFRGSFFNDSNRQHSRSNLTGKGHHAEHHSI